MDQSRDPPRPPSRPPPRRRHLGVIVQPWPPFLRPGERFFIPSQCRKEDSEISSYCQSSHSKRLGSAEPSQARACPSCRRLKGAQWGRRLGTKEGLGLWVLLAPAARTGGTFQSPALLSLPREALPARRDSPVLPPSFPSLSPRAWPGGSHHVLCGLSPVRHLRPPRGALTTRPLPAPVWATGSGD